MNKSEICFNRTFMELKQYTDYQQLTIYACFNRTFMELKQKNLQARRAAYLVLIGPSWN